MSTTPMIWSGQGPVMIGTYDPVNGTPEMGYLTNLYRVGCGNRSLTTTPGRETKRLKESCSGQRLDLKELEIGKTLDVSLELFQFDARTLAAAFLGSAVAKVGGTVTNEALPELAAGDYFFLKHPKVSSVVIEDSTAVTPLAYVEGTHYTIESADHARIKLIAHPASHVEPVKVDYSYADYTNIAAFSASNVERGIVFNGVNQDGQHARVIIPRCSLALSGDFSWITDEEATLTLVGSALYVDLLSANADWGPFMRIDALPGA